jgi:myosin heavy subunit
MNWLREHNRDQVRNAASLDLEQNILTFHRDTAAALRYDTSAALDLVAQAAALIRGIQDRAADSEARAQSLAECALQKLQIAEARFHSAEAARGLAQETLSKLSSRLQDAERELMRTQPRIATAEAQLAEAERHTRAAETRAINAEAAVNQIEDAIRSQLVGLQTDLTGRTSRAA